MLFLKKLRKHQTGPLPSRVLKWHGFWDQLYHVSPSKHLKIRGSYQAASWRRQDNQTCSLPLTHTSNFRGEKQYFNTLQTRWIYFWAYLHWAMPKRPYTFLLKKFYYTREQSPEKLTLPNNDTLKSPEYSKTVCIHLQYKETPFADNVTFQIQFSSVFVPM